MEELVQQLGFRVVEKNGAWQLQRVNEKGETVVVQPILMPEVWQLWNALLDASGLLPSES